MLKMLIVDDEVNTANNLATMISWSDLGIGVIEVAYDGREALQKAIDFQPDIILSDIIMPKMNGLDLARQLADLTRSHVIFITGHWEETYIKSAFKAGVVDYILKPVNISELQMTVESVVRKVSDSNRQKGYIEGLERKYAESRPLLRNKLFNSLISCTINDKANLEEELYRLELSLEVDMTCSVFCLQVSPLLQGEERALADHLLAIEIVHLCSSLLEFHGGGYCFQHVVDCYVCIVPIFNVDAAVEFMEDLAKQIQTLLKASLAVEVTIGIGEWVDSLLEIGYSFDKAFQAMRQSFYQGRNSIIFADKVRFLDRADKALTVQRLMEITEYLQYGNIHKTVEEIEEIFRVIRHNQNEDPAKTIGVCIQLYTMLNGILLKSDIGKSEDLGRYTMAIRRIMEVATLEEAKAIILEICLYINETFQKERMSESAVVRKMKDYIIDHYRENLTVAQIAQQVYLSDAYCCLLFKQETGITINNYITELRMQDAQRMILSEKKNIIDICFVLGYNDPKYFSRVFKKWFGVSPSEYRKTSK